jgi:hypothetical protein
MMHACVLTVKAAVKHSDFIGLCAQCRCSMLERVCANVQLCFVCTTSFALLVIRAGVQASEA